jgi:hypothetical protein
MVVFPARGESREGCLTDNEDRMIAVMTMNTGYFVSVLSGVFLGMFLLGSRADGGVDTRWHQC